MACNRTNSVAKSCSLCSALCQSSEMNGGFGGQGGSGGGKQWPQGSYSGQGQQPFHLPPPVSFATNKSAKGKKESGEGGKYIIEDALLRLDIYLDGCYRSIETGFIGIFEDCVARGIGRVRVGGI
jgi:hypothetical protein